MRVMVYVLREGSAQSLPDALAPIKNVWVSPM